MVFQVHRVVLPDSEEFERGVRPSNYGWSTGAVHERTEAGQEAQKRGQETDEEGELKLMRRVMHHPIGHYYRHL